MPVNNQRADRGANRKRGNTPELTAEQERTKLARELRIKPKTKAMVDKLLNDEKLSQTQAYIDTHNTSNRRTAAIAASKLLQKPNVQIYKDSAIRKAKTKIVSLVDSGNEQIALKASQDILDRTEGKAAIKTEHTSKTVHVSVDLSGFKLGNHYVPAPTTPIE